VRLPMFEDTDRVYRYHELLWDTFPYLFIERGDIDVDEAGVPSLEVDWYGGWHDTICDTDDDFYEHMERLFRQLKRDYCKYLQRHLPPCIQQHLHKKIRVKFNKRKQ